MRTAWMHAELTFETATSTMAQFCTLRRVQLLPFVFRVKTVADATPAAADAAAAAAAAGSLSIVLNCDDCFLHSMLVARC